jgi:hypothetical protein
VVQCGISAATCITGAHSAGQKSMCVQENKKCQQSCAH